MDTQELMSRMSENLSVRRAFGSAYEKAGLLVIPVALVAGGGGGGEGTVPKDQVGTHVRRRRRATIHLMGPKVPWGPARAGGSVA